MPTCPAISTASTAVPSSASAPTASSGFRGAPSLRTASTSTRAPSAAATSTATGTPPRGSAITIGRSNSRGRSRAASCRPASRRFSNMLLQCASRAGSPVRREAVRDGLLLHTRWVVLPPARNEAVGRPEPADGVHGGSADRRETTPDQHGQLRQARAVRLLSCLARVRVVGVPLRHPAAEQVDVLQVQLRCDRNDLNLVLVTVVP